MQVCKKGISLSGLFLLISDITYNPQEYTGKALRAGVFSFSQCQTPKPLQWIDKTTEKWKLSVHCLE